MSSEDPNSASKPAAPKPPKDKTKPPKDEAKPPKGDDPVDAPDDPVDPPAPPGAPETPVSVACVSGDMVDIVTFEPGADGGPVSSFSLWLHAADGAVSMTATAAASARSFVVEVAEAGERRYSVSASGPGGESARSASAGNGVVSMSAEVPPSGTTLRSSNGEVVLELPAGAFPATTTVRVEEAPGELSGGFVRLAGIYDIAPSGALGAPATLSVRYALTVPHVQVSERILAAAGLVTYDDDAKVWVRAANVTADGTYLTGTLSHFSYWSGATIQPHGTNPSTTDYCSGVCHDLSAGADSSTRYDTRDSQVCFNCHGNASAALPPAGASGRNVQADLYACPGQSRPASATTHPVASGDLYCTSCHDPHASPASSPALLRSWDPITGRYVAGAGGTGPGDAFCWTCHGTVSNKRTNYYVPGYWTRTGGDRKTGYSASAHASLDTTSSVTCTACHGEHGGPTDGLLPDRQLGTCTAAGNGCHSDPANATGGTNIRAAFLGSSNPLAHHDVDYAAQLVTGARINCTSCHNAHKDSQSNPFSDPDNLQVGFAASAPGIADGTGSVWLRVGAKHDGVPPVLSAIARDALGARWNAPRITWTTNEKATSWVQYGLTTSYELGAFGNDTLVNGHVVDMSGLNAYVLYHYRIRTVDALGNVAYSADYTYTPSQPPPAPTLIHHADTTIYSLQAVDFAWNTVTSPDGDGVQYQVEVSNPSNFGYVWQSGWLSSPAYTEMGLKYTGDVSWRVRARDAVHPDAVGAWSAWDTFYLTDNNPDPSCPTLYTWDGDGYRFVTDVMGLGSIGVKKGPSAYLKPEPVEDSIIPPGSLVPRDGSLDIRLTDEKPEVEFVDEVTLRAIDHPAGTRLLTNDLHWGAFDGGREDTRYFTIADPQPVEVTYERRPVLGTETIPPTDVSAAVSAEGDGVVAESGVYDDNIWTFDLGELDDPEQVKLVLAGWVDYANPPEKAAWIASGKRPPRSCIEVQDGNGQWVEVGAAPHPPGYPKTVVYDLTGLFPEGVTDYRVRMRIYMRMNVDYVAVDTTPDAAVEVTELVPVAADLSYKGLSRFTKTPYPTFDYDDVVSTLPKLQDGAFTRYGDVLPLLEAADDCFVVMNAGDDLAISFPEPAAPAAGMERTYMIHTDGFHQTTSGKVDPMPFHAMSNYPYPADEHYPDDAEHLAYRAEWNTRTYGSTAIDWVQAHEPVSISEGEGPFSVDTDEALLLVTMADGTVATATVSAGWESATSSFATGPTPSSPGTAVAAARLAKASGRNADYWRTDLTTADQSVNWQLMRFVMPVSGPTVRSASIVWYGHGEPTALYETRLEVWQPSTSGWTTVRNAPTPSDTQVSYMSIAGSSTFCIRCHDGTVPAGVAYPTAGLVNVGATWPLATGDYHGGRSGGGYGSGLAAGYTRGSEVPCTTCHASHGSQSIYHFPSAIGGAVVGTVTSGTQVQAVCAACHTGNLQAYHSGGWCVECHTYGGHDGAATALEIVLADCLDCHRHGAAWTHADVGGCWDSGRDCHLLPSAARAF